MKIKHYLTLFLLATVILISCKKEEVKKTETPAVIYNSNPSEEICFLSAKFDNLFWNGVEGQNYFLQPSLLDTVVNLIDSTVYANFSSTILQDSTKLNLSEPVTDFFTVSFVANSFTYKGYFDTDTNVNKVFAAGSRYYSIESNTSIPSVAISYIDRANSQIWRTDIGSQANSTFNVESATRTVNKFGVQVMKVKANFTCKVYNQTSPSTYKTITNGTFYLSYKL